MRVDPDAPRLELIGDATRSRHILAPYGCPQPRVGAIRPRNDIGLVRPLEHRQDRRKRLFLHDPGRLGRVIDDGRGDEVAPRVLDGSAEGSRQAFCGQALPKILGFVVLHAVLHGAKEDVGVGALADLEGSHKRHELLPELVVDLLVHVQPFDHHADLARAEEGEDPNLCERQSNAHQLTNEVHYLWNDRIDVDIVADDRRVVPPQLQRHPLQGLRTTRHDALARENRAGETDLVDARVLRDHRAEVIASAQRLDHPGREALRRQLGELQAAIRRKRGGLDDHGVPRVHGGDDLADGQQDGKVPRHDGPADAERGVPLDDLVFVRVFDDRFGDLDCRDGSSPLHGHSDLDGGLAERLALFLRHEPGQCLLVCFDLVGEVVESGATLGERGLGPFAERLASGFNGSIEVLLSRNGNLGVGLPVRRIDAVTGLRGRGQLIVDHIVESLDWLVDGDRGEGIITVMSKDMMMN